MSSSIPISWIDTLFSRFSAAWGAQKVGAMFPAESHADVKALWAAQLARFEPETLRHALAATLESGREWPPSLPEFVATCQRSATERRARAPAVALPMPNGSPEVAERAVSEAGKALQARRPNRDWASRILARVSRGERVSLAAVQMAQRAMRAGEAVE